MTFFPLLHSKSKHISPAVNYLKTYLALTDLGKVTSFLVTVDLGFQKIDLHFQFCLSYLSKLGTFFAHSWTLADFKCISEVMPVISWKNRLKLESNYGNALRSYCTHLCWFDACCTITGIDVQLLSKYNEKYKKSMHRQP